MNTKTLCLLILAHASYALAACTSRTIDGGDDESCDPAIACEAFACQTATACEEDAEGHVDCTYENAADDSVCDLSAPQSADGVCASGACVAPPCSSNDECPGDHTCISGTCAAQGGMGASCDSGDDDDCGEGLLCGASNTCIGDTGTACSDNIQCKGTCVDGTCGPRGDLGDTCDASDVADCDSGLRCASSGVCLADDGGVCTGNDDCVNVCIGGVCAPAATLGDRCDAADDDDCEGGLFCASDATCLVPSGETCLSNNECEDTCVGGTCGPLAGNGGSCDSGDDADCNTGMACSVANTCLAQNGESCAANSECLQTCIAGTCTDAAGEGGTCDGSDSVDCQSGLACSSGGTCLRNDGDSCTDNSQCLNTCLGGICGPTSNIGGSCDSADDGDCGMGMFCGSADTCLVVDGGSCSANDECQAACISDVCAAVSGAGGTCDVGDDADCQSGLGCSTGGICALPNGEVCTANDECLESCIGGLCASPSGDGGMCDTGDNEDCAPTYECGASDTCIPGLGSPCTANSDCPQTCIEGLCANIAGAGEICDAGDADDCQNGGCVGGTCGGTVTGQVFVVEVDDHIAGNSTTLCEIEFYDTTPTYVSADTTATDAWDSMTSGVPQFWNSGSSWYRSNLFDGETLYTVGPGEGQVNCTGFHAPANAAYSDNWARFAVFLLSPSDIGSIRLAAGSPNSKIPKVVRVYVANDYDYTTNIQNRQNDGMVLIWSYEFTDVTYWQTVNWVEVNF